VFWVITPMRAPGLPQHTSCGIVPLSESRRVSMRTDGPRLSAALAGGALALLLAGCATASSDSKPHSTATVPAVATLTGAATPSDAHTAYLTDYSNSDSPHSTVVLAGAVGDYGQAVTVHGNGTTDPDHGDQLDLHLTQGSFRLRIGDLDKKVVDAFTNFPSDRTTCSGRVSVSGPAPIVPGSGTGDYRGITGVFGLSITIDEVDQRAHCGPSSKFLSQAIVITGSGAIKL
jgi:hypothetical protein